jgi:serine/threonine protein kinase
MSEWLGKTLGKVQINLLLARGGMAEVYLGTHTNLQRPVAVKLLRNQYQDDPELLERFQREARVVARLRHPNIVQVFDFDTIDGQPYLVMEYIPGPSLATYLKALHAKKHRLPVDKVNKLITKLAAALKYAHGQGVIHRDVKPGNILLTSSSTPVMAGKLLPDDFDPVLTDFGLVRFLQSTTQTATGVIAGTPAYMSPEQAQGEHTDGRSDIYSLGIVLYEMLAGQVPFKAETTMGVLIKHISLPPEPIAGLDPAQQAVLDKALSKDRELRYKTPVDLATEYERALHGGTEAPTLAPTGKWQILSEPQNEPRKRKVWLPIAAGILALMTLAVLILIILPRATPSLPPSAVLPPTIPPTKEAPIAAAPDPETIGRLRFQDGAAVLDQVTVSAFNFPPAPAGNQFELWLLGGEQRRSIGIFRLDANGKGTVSFVDPEGRNLLMTYSALEITLEPDPDTNPNPSGIIAFSEALLPQGLTHIRHLLVSFPGAPEQISLIQGLNRDSRQIDETLQIMLAANQDGDEASVRLQSEAVLNALVGERSEDYRDWNTDGQITDFSDGYGFLLNGENAGYIVGVASHAGFAAAAPDASDNIRLHAGHVQVSTQNIEQWTLELRDIMIGLQNSNLGPETEAGLRQAVTISGMILNGIDLNGNEQIEPVPGEGGVRTVYEHTYYMADIIIYNKNP